MWWVLHGGSKDVQAYIGEYSVCSIYSILASSGNLVTDGGRWGLSFNSDSATHTAYTVRSVQVNVNS